MPEFKITKFFSNSGTRNEVRMRVVHELSKEACGKGRDDLASRYTYYVETLEDGSRIFLRRPANLHNGFDFLVCVENINFAKEGKRRRNYPKHEDIIEDLNKKKSTSEKHYQNLYALIKRVYECEDVDYTGCSTTFSEGYSVELILKSLKWLFIEQDIRYWNYSGRDMLWTAINRI